MQLRSRPGIPIFGTSGAACVGLSRRQTLPPEPLRYLGAKLVRMAVRRKNDAEIRNETLTTLIAGLTPGGSGIEGVDMGGTRSPFLALLRHN